MNSPVINPPVQLGDRGSATAKLQRLLRLHGYAQVAIDSEFGETTQQAVLHFQQKWQLPTSGRVATETWLCLKRVLVHSSFSFGEGESPTVTEIQRLLWLHGHTYVIINGYFGAITRAAVMDFQSQHQLQVDGNITAQTWVALRDRPQ